MLSFMASPMARGYAEQGSFRFDKGYRFSVPGGCPARLCKA
jgi:hypothetical protein